MALHHAAGLGIGMADISAQHSKAGVNPIGSVGHHQSAGVQDLMTDSSQLPSSACPTPLHSPLFSATNASGTVHHHASGEPVVSSSPPVKIEGLGGGDNIVSHLDLDIGKEMDGFQAHLIAKSKAIKAIEPVVRSGSTNQRTPRLEDEDVDVDIEDEDEGESLKKVLLNTTF